ncbi:MAG: non-canonical purine NTP pyrophosphatase [Deltaproteobacteria bacterium]|jgi:XTP/dITP diphosphohydrolase|nr:non-canonical purine NTP pyrophosphatase [Deltaproteobacteria bacterium]
MAKDDDRSLEEIGSQRCLKLFVGSGNPGKIVELSAMLGFLGAKIFDATGKTTRHLGLTPLAPPVEDGSTFYENAYIKARHYADWSGLPALADDSGLLVYALKGAPGVRSARFGPQWEPTLDKSRNQYLLEKMKGITDRRAAFEVTLVLAKPLTREVMSWKGHVLGEILEEPRGDGGFGYDPIFYLPALGRTMAQLSFEEKNQVSHRTMAARRMKEDRAKILEFLGFPELI